MHQGIESIATKLLEAPDTITSVPEKELMVLLVRDERQAMDDEAPVCAAAAIAHPVI